MQKLCYLALIVLENYPTHVFKMLSAWAEQAEKFRNGEISKEQYDRWRYTFPAEDTTQIWGKVPSQDFSDALIKALKRNKTI